MDPHPHHFTKTHPHDTEMFWLEAQGLKELGHFIDGLPKAIEVDSRKIVLEKIETTPATLPLCTVIYGMATYFVVPTKPRI